MAKVGPMSRRLGFLLVFAFASSAMAAPDWAIHEWGTFTSLQDESGTAISGINTDDEPVPYFVHRLASGILQTPSQVPVTFFQGAPSCHPDVTMRLETPVIYFHPPDNSKEIQNASALVKFRGGWLTEFYPVAATEVDGLKNGDFRFGVLGSDSISGLDWGELKIGGDWPLTNTSEHVWTSPRAVDAALVRTSSGESERFLFYRGVGHIDAPLKISRENEELVFRSQLGGLPAPEHSEVNTAWLVDIRANGSLAFRRLPAMMLEKEGRSILARTPAKFLDQDFATANLEQLKSQLRKMLIAEGLFADEAEALLNTWELSYFKSAGLRVFFIVPPAWTDFYLPLEISLPVRPKRVMVGRIELVTPQQRDRLRQIAACSPETIEEEARVLGTNYFARLKEVLSDGRQSEFTAVERGSKPLGTIMAVPKTYQTYLDLGRFRNALILEEAKRNPSPGLQKFIEQYRLQGRRDF
jgi:hypothetical protein